MQKIFEHYKKTGYLHHAHVIEGEHSTIAPLIVSQLVKYFNIEEKGNPDLLVKFYESFGIDEAREFKSAQTRAPFGNNKKFYILGAESFTHEAQNALLKTFEEPISGNHFFLIIPQIEMLIPTLRSRVSIASGTPASEDEAKNIALKFIDASLEERFVIAKKLADKKDRDTADRELFRRVLDHIERIVYSRNTGIHSENLANIFKEIFRAKTYLADRGSSPKMLLEHIAVVLPIT